MKDYKTAVSDLDAALGAGPDADMERRIKTALAESHMTTGRIEKALDETRALVAASKGGKQRSQALFLRAKALLLAVDRYGERFPGTRRGKMRNEAAAVLEDLYAHGNYWKAKVVQLVDAGVDDPLRWAAGSANPFVSWLIADSLRRRSECEEAERLYDALLEAGAFTSESLFGLGFCAFHESRYLRALDRLSAYFDSAGAEDVHYGEAAYLRFKAAESLYLRSVSANTVPRQGTEAAADRYLKLLLDFLERAPRHAFAFEAWFRLGQWHRDRGDFSACARAFSRVRAERAFKLRSMFLGAQCRVEAVLEASENAAPEPQLVRTALAEADAFVAEARSAAGNGGQSSVLEPLEAKAVVMAAAITTRAGVGSMADRLGRLADFEKRFGRQTQLLAEVLSLRTAAHASMGDFDSAGRELERLLSLKEAGAYRLGALKRLGVAFLKEGSRQEGEGDSAGARRSLAVALKVYQRMLADSRDRGAADLGGMETLVADLQRRLED
jgi:hypothetical protein